MKNYRKPRHTNRPNTTLEGIMVWRQLEHDADLRAFLRRQERDSFTNRARTLVLASLAFLLAVMSAARTVASI